MCLPVHTLSSLSERNHHPDFYGKHIFHVLFTALLPKCTSSLVIELSFVYHLDLSMHGVTAHPSLHSPLCWGDPSMLLRVCNLPIFMSACISHDLTY